MQFKVDRSTKKVTVDRLFWASATLVVGSIMLLLIGCGQPSGITIQSADLPEQGQMTFLERKSTPSDRSVGTTDPRLQVMSASRWSSKTDEEQKRLEAKAIRLQTETAADGRYQLPSSAYLPKPDQLINLQPPAVFKPAEAVNQKEVEALDAQLKRPKDVSLPGALDNMKLQATEHGNQPSAQRSLEAAIHPALENAPKGFRQPRRTKSEILIWNNGTIPMQFEKAVPANLKAKVLALGQEWSRGTMDLVRFVERKDEDFYVQVKLLPTPKTTKDSKGKTIQQKVFCRASLGRNPEKVSLLSIHSSCSSADLTQKLGHLIGLDYEHKRSDRNKHVLVNFDHIVDSEVALYATNGQDLYERPYDVTSIMHVSPLEHAKDQSKPTMISFSQALDLANMVISWGDVASVVALYGGTAASTTR